MVRNSLLAVLVALLAGAGYARGPVSSEATAPSASPEEIQSGERPAVGFWVRLTFDPETDARMWDELAQAETTDLFVETFYHGFVIYPHSNIFDQRIELAGADPLRAAIDQAHAHGIRLHAWIHCLQWGPDYEQNPQIPRSRLVGEVDSWLCRDAEGRPFHEFFVSPAVREVRDKVTRLCLDICHRYPDIDGINLDYIRWPEGGEYWYDEANVESFIAAGHPDPRTDRSEENLDAFQHHSAGQVTALVETIATTLHGVYPSVKLSAAFFPGRDERDAWFKAQDWRAWIRRHFLDLATPMCYSFDLQNVAEEARTVMEIAGPAHVPVWAGLAVHRGTDHAPAADQLSAVRGLGLAGVVFFSHGWIAEHPEEFRQIGAWFRANSLMEQPKG
jgi:uncharacterized lipoprotein YddW (UPF0748 family)